MSETICKLVEEIQDLQAQKLVLQAAQDSANKQIKELQEFVDKSHGPWCTLCARRNDLMDRLHKELECGSS
jgi:hypothetical protein